jgi:hypothetical protein
LPSPVWIVIDLDRAFFISSEQKPMIEHHTGYRDKPDKDSQADRMFTISGIDDRSESDGGSDDMGMKNRRWDLVTEMTHLDGVRKR